MRPENSNPVAYYITNEPFRRISIKPCYGSRNWQFFSPPFGGMGGCNLHTAEGLKWGAAPNLPETHALPTMTFSGRVPGLGASPRSPGHPTENDAMDSMDLEGLTNEVIYEVTLLLISGPCYGWTSNCPAPFRWHQCFLGQGILLELEVWSMMSKSPGNFYMKEPPYEVRHWSMEYISASITCGSHVKFGISCFPFWLIRFLHHQPPKIHACNICNPALSSHGGQANSLQST